jgi:hypothetical protein
VGPKRALGEGVTGLQFWPTAAWLGPTPYPRRANARLAEAACPGERDSARGGFRVDPVGSAVSPRRSTGHTNFTWSDVGPGGEVNAPLPLPHDPAPENLWERQVAPPNASEHYCKIYDLAGDERGAVVDSRPDRANPATRACVSPPLQRPARESRGKVGASNRSMRGYDCLRSGEGSEPENRATERFSALRAVQGRQDSNLQPPVLEDGGSPSGETGAAFLHRVRSS